MIFNNFNRISVRIFLTLTTMYELNFDTLLPVLHITPAEWDPRSTHLKRSLSTGWLEGELLLSQVWCSKWELKLHRFCQNIFGWKEFDCNELEEHLINTIVRLSFNYCIWIIKFQQLNEFYSWIAALIWTGYTIKKVWFSACEWYYKV